MYVVGPSTHAGSTTRIRFSFQILPLFAPVSRLNWERVDKCLSLHSHYTVKRGKAMARILAATASPNGCFDTRLFRFKTQNSSNFNIVSHFSPLSNFSSMRKTNLSALLVPNSRVIITSRARKKRKESGKSFLNRPAVGASLTTQPDSDTEETLPQPSAPYSIKIPVGDRHVSTYFYFINISVYSF